MSENAIGSPNVLLDVDERRISKQISRPNTKTGNNASAILKRVNADNVFWVMVDEAIDLMFVFFVNPELIM